ncbi:MAG: crossover junction endodeoxyribonuclease RuvC [Gammaproteobacteria bacterium]|nr:MAG: crossover junction endodeoxyribonuclease RuvC [Gammaproteobacteria bacterium]
MTLILGIDPGSRVTGFGIIETRGNALRYVTSGCIRIADESFPERLNTIYHDLGEVIEQHAPQVMAVEQVFMARNAASALKLGQARGAAIVAGVSRGLPVHEYSARQIKQAAVGMGAATKAQVQHMVMTLLRLPSAPAEDAADALAAAICHAHTSASLVAVAGARSVRRGRIRS